MPVYEFIVTRNITESIVVRVKAQAIEAAHEIGLADPLEHKAPWCKDWEADDCSEGDAYLGDKDEYLIVKEGEQCSTNAKQPLS